MAIEFTCNLCGVRTQDQIKDGHCAACGRPLGVRTDKKEQDFDPNAALAGAKGTAKESLPAPTALEARTPATAATPAGAPVDDKKKPATDQPNDKKI